MPYKYAIHRKIIRDVLDQSRAAFRHYSKCEDALEFHNRVAKTLCEYYGYTDESMWRERVLNLVYGTPREDRTGITELTIAASFLVGYGEEEYVNTVVNVGGEWDLCSTVVAVAQREMPLVVDRVLLEIWTRGREEIRPTLSWDYTRGRPLVVEVGEDDWEEVEIREGEGWSTDGEITEADFAQFLRRMFDQYSVGGGVST